MPTPAKSLGETVWSLPPLILHPFNERVSATELTANSKAALMMAGLIADDGSDRQEMKRRLLNGRLSEIRMLFYLGKDVVRWLEQCRESAAREAELAALGLEERSFAALLTTDPPGAVREKLVRWGVADYSAIFARAIGIHTLFAQPPSLDCLGEEFLGGYHRYADAAFRCYMDSRPYSAVGAANFRFDLYASGEYSRMLEAEWEGGAPQTD